MAKKFFIRVGASQKGIYSRLAFAKQISFAEHRTDMEKKQHRRTGSGKVFCQQNDVSWRRLRFKKKFKTDVFE